MERVCMCSWALCVVSSAFWGPISGPALEYVDNKLPVCSFAALPRLNIRWMIPEDIPGGYGRVLLDSEMGFWSAQHFLPH